MSDPLLQVFSDEFAVSIGSFPSAKALRAVLLKRTEVRDVKHAIAQGRIPDDRVRAVVNELMRDFRKGHVFPHEIGLCALCLALEDHKTETAEEFLLDLARLDIQEMPISPEFAKTSVRRWFRWPDVKQKVASFSRQMKRTPWRVRTRNENLQASQAARNANIVFGWHDWASENEAA